ncbi:MAG: glucose-1-phosphate adenylyltransferase [Candidatus Neomarinimicrobiota bacterium]|jgi:glucose-1-phosphate adenylyltransferase|nr:glucose-1-phosphate adenylyltransferase [Candidatus Neomarinimicrobiota bacterium]MDD3966408.1 glucose-1-phosphate adenylyltransferase [Candidatus Neomarinimicrobiota bacterium]MDX9780018.1 glucose-1-phosphate adenylyltransferase [bacterium]
MRNVLSVILGGGRGTRLAPLTTVRSKPAVPIGGKYRLIDIPISNCLNSNIRKIYILTQFNSESLHRHINQTYKLDNFTDGFLEVLAASQSIDNMNWYQGTADAVRHNLKHFDSYSFREYLILAGDHLYRMNYSDFVASHRKTEADISISVKPVTREEAKGFGILKVNEKGRIVKFAEKPKDPKLLDAMTSPTGDPERPYWGSMGIYVFRRGILHKTLTEITEDDFGGDIIPAAIHDYRVMAFFFNEYWEDIGTIRAFYQANMNFTRAHPEFRFVDEHFPIFTHARMLPGSRIIDAHIENSLINDGALVQAGIIRNSILGIRSVVREGTEIHDSYIMGNDYFETEHQEDRIPLGIGKHCLIRCAIVDKNARIGNNVKIVNKDNLLELESENYCIRDGIVVVKKDVSIPDGTVI